MKVDVDIIRFAHFDKKRLDMEFLREAISDVFLLCYPVHDY